MWRTYLHTSGSRSACATPNSHRWYMKCTWILCFSGLWEGGRCLELQSDLQLIRAVSFDETERTHMSWERDFIELWQFLAGCSVVPRLTAIIRSRKISVKRKCRKAKIKSPLKCIENHSMHSNGLNNSPSSEDPP